MSDLYETLGVESDASGDDIKRAYRRLSMTYHPDRRLDEEEKRAAGKEWLRISSAYDILADSQRRMVYDELGPQHLEQGLALLSDKIATADDLHREWRRVQARQSEREHLGRMNVSGSFVVSASASDVLQPREPDAPLWRRLKPELSSVAMNEEMHVKLDPKNSLSVTNQAVTKAGLGGSTLRVGFRRALSERSTLQLSSALSHEPYAIAIAASRRLSAHSTGSVSVQLAAKGLAQSTLQIQRQLTRRLLGELALSLPSLSFFGLPSDDESGLKLSLQRSPYRQKLPQEGEGGESGGGESGGGESGGGESGGGSGAQPPFAQSAPALAAAPPAAGSYDVHTASGLTPSIAQHRWPGRRLLKLWQAARAQWMAMHAYLCTLPMRARTLQAKAWRRAGQSALEVLLSPSGAKVGCKLEWRHSAHSRTKLAANAGVGSFAFTLGVERTISPTSPSRIGAALQFSQRGMSTSDCHRGASFLKHTQRTRCPALSHSPCIPCPHDAP